MFCRERHKNCHANGETFFMFKNLVKNFFPFFCGHYCSFLGARGGLKNPVYFPEPVIFELLLPLHVKLVKEVDWKSEVVT